jgi:hypothetical protein
VGIDIRYYLKHWKKHMNVMDNGFILYHYNGTDKALTNEQFAVSVTACLINQL